jgi:hypothetical protein
VQRLLAGHLFLPASEFLGHLPIFGILAVLLVYGSGDLKGSTAGGRADGPVAATWTAESRTSFSRLVGAMIGARL